jgi:hypothetical protein
MPRQRLIVATLLFLGTFAVIAQLAWNTAIATSGPWFSPAISRDVYSTTMIAATVLVAVLGALASGQAASTAREARALDLRLNILRGSGVIVSGSSGIDIDRDIEETLDEILGGVDGSAAPTVTMDREAHDTLVTVTAEGRAQRQDVVLREVARARSALHKAGSRIWGAVAGPMAAGIVFLGLAGAMLPGSEGFAESHFMTNTALILFLGYGWPFLVGWVAVGLGFARAHEGKHVHESHQWHPQRKSTLFSPMTSCCPFGRRPSAERTVAYRPMRLFTILCRVSMIASPITMDDSMSAPTSRDPSPIDVYGPMYVSGPITQS